MRRRGGRRRFTTSHPGSAKRTQSFARKRTRFAGELGVLRFAIWAELPQEADAAGWLAQLSNDYDSEDREQLRQRQIYRGERNASCPQ